MKPSDYTNALTNMNGVRWLTGEVSGASSVDGSLRSRLSSATSSLP